MGINTLLLEFGRTVNMFNGRNSGNTFIKLDDILRNMKLQLKMNETEEIFQTKIV